MLFRSLSSLGLRLGEALFLYEVNCSDLLIDFVTLPVIVGVTVFPGEDRNGFFLADMAIGPHEIKDRKSVV